MRVALFPGSFDPITIGHIEIIERGLKLFDKIIIGIGLNSSKISMFEPDLRKEWIELTFENNARIEVCTYSELTVQFAKKTNANFILRGLRNAPDFEYEKNIDLLNRHLDNEIETVYCISSPTTGHISSTLVREVIKFKGNLDGLVPVYVINDIYKTKYL